MIKPRCRSTSGKSLAKLSLPGHAAWAASRSAPAQSRASGDRCGVFAASQGAVAVLLVVGQEPGQVAQLGGRAGGDRATAVAVGTHGRPVGEEEVAKLVDVRLFERFVSAGGVGVFAHVVGVFHRHAGRADPLVGPDRVQQALERGQFALGQHRHLLRRLP